MVALPDTPPGSAGGRPTMTPPDAAAPAVREAVDLLIVDDDACIRELLAVAARRSGFSVCTAEDGHAALGQLSRRRPRLIVTDIFMPDMDGYEVIMRVRAEQPGVPILAITGGGITGEAERTFRPARHLGCRRTLAKPFDHEEFVTAVKELLAG